MSVLVSIDPGKDNIGVAVWRNGHLDDARSFSTGAERDAAGWVVGALPVLQWFCPKYGYPRTIAYEQPQIVGGWSQGSIGDDVLQISGAAGMLIGLLVAEHMHHRQGTVPTIHAIRPAHTKQARGWTGGRKKPPNHLRAYRRLHPHEIKTLVECSDLQNPETLYEIMRAGDAAQLEHMFDAVCIGLYHLDRWDI